MMRKKHYLEVSFRKGRPLAAYLYLRTGAKSARTESVGDGLFMDYGSDGEPVGIEITTPESVSIDAINAILTKLGLEEVSREELRPLLAA